MKSSIGLTLISFAGAALALQSYCEPGYKPISDKDLQIDLSKLNREFVVYQNSSTPPTTTSIVTQINLCDALPIPDEPKNDEICQKGTFICRRTLHVKADKESIDIVQTIARDADNHKLDAEFKAIKPEDDATKSGYQYSLALNGGEYAGKPQSALVTLECDESQTRDGKVNDPTIISYNNNVLTLQWKTVYACATKVGEKVPDKKEPPVDKKEGMSGIGIFFTIVFVLAAVYFVGGAIYNFKMYNARGLDLIPHREFWFDLPYLIRELYAHIVDSVMSRRRGSGGYVAV